MTCDVLRSTLDVHSSLNSIRYFAPADEDDASAAAAAAAAADVDSSITSPDVNRASIADRVSHITLHPSHITLHPSHVTSDINSDGEGEGGLVCDLGKMNIGNSSSSSSSSSSSTIVISSDESDDDACMIVQVTCDV